MNVNQCIHCIKFQASETPFKSELLPAHHHSAPLQSTQKASEGVKEPGIYDRYDRD